MRLRGTSKKNEGEKQADGTASDSCPCRFRAAHVPNCMRHGRPPSCCILNCEGSARRRKCRLESFSTFGAKKSAFKPRIAFTLDGKERRQRSDLPFVPDGHDRDQRPNSDRNQKPHRTRQSQPNACQPNCQWNPCENAGVAPGIFVGCHAGQHR